MIYIFKNTFFVIYTLRLDTKKKNKKKHPDLFPSSQHEEQASIQDKERNAFSDMQLSVGSQLAPA